MMRAIRAAADSSHFRLMSFVVLGWASMSFADAMADDPKSSIEPIDSAAVTVFPQPSGRYKIDLQVRNAGDREGEASISLIGAAQESCGDGKLLSDSALSFKLAPNAVKIVRAEISDIRPPAVCFLQLTTEQGKGKSSLKQVTLAQHYLTWTMIIALLFGIFVSAVVAVLTFGHVTKKLGVTGSFAVGSPAWDFAKSWTSTATVASAVVTAALSLSALPDLTRYASKPGYAVISLLMSLVVVVAPFVFVAFRDGRIGTDDEGHKAVLYSGSARLFFVSTAITLFAAIGQILVLLILLTELSPYFEWSSPVDHPPSVAVSIEILVAGALIWAIISYVATAMILTIELQKAVDDPHPKVKKGFAADRDKDAENAADGSGTFGRLSWPVP